MHAELVAAPGEGREGEAGAAAAVDEAKVALAEASRSWSGVQTGTVHRVKAKAT
jgi:hypothetical protein